MKGKEKKGKEKTPTSVMTRPNSESDIRLTHPCLFSAIESHMYKRRSDPSPATAGVYKRKLCKLQLDPIALSVPSTCLDPVLYLSYQVTSRYLGSARTRPGSSALVASLRLLRRGCVGRILDLAADGAQLPV